MRSKLASIPPSPIAAIEADLDALLDKGKPIRRDFEDGSRLHIDRPLPFVCVCIGLERNAAFEIASANASYLIAANSDFAAEAVRVIAGRLGERAGGFFLIDFGELAKDRFLTDDAPVLPPFEIALSGGDSEVERAALKRFAKAASGRESKYRTPRIVETPGDNANFAGVSRLTVRFAPIYKAPGSDKVYPGVMDRIVANMVDSGLQAVASFLQVSELEAPATHRALGRRAFIDAVSRADRALDKVASAFDFLLAVTPINAELAWQEFKVGGFEQAPKFLYRPLTFEVGAEKRKLYAVALDSLEDPLLTELLLEKQQELDLQLAMLAARETPRFVELGRALYGGIEPELLASAGELLGRTEDEPNGKRKTLRAESIASAARDMIAGYRKGYPAFDASVEIRADLPAGLLVSGNRLLISRDTRIEAGRLNALLSHEIGVHLLTYTNGEAQGLRILRNGLAGYEGMQEGLAVLAEYLAGGMTVARLRQVAARVVSCAAMLDGATFQDAYRQLHHDLGFDGRAAFNIVLRVYRGGGLAKDAIYLRGVHQILNHLKAGASLTPFWMGKISARHFGAIEELRARGLLRPPRLEPAFLSLASSRNRLKNAMGGITPLDMIET